jgi:hypothetical protein
MKTLTNCQTCTENYLRIILLSLSFSGFLPMITSHLTRQKEPKCTYQVRFTEKFSESQPGSGASFTGGFLILRQQDLENGY